MAWSMARSPYAEQNIQNTNILFAPVGKGVPVSSKEYNVNFLLQAQSHQEAYRALSPSGFLTSVKPVTLNETTTTLDVDGEAVALTTNSLPIANTIRLGRSTVIVNGWKIVVSNIDGTNGLHNNIVLDAPPTSGTRYDLVFLEIWLAELGGTSASISNTSNKPTATTVFKFGNTQFRGTNITDDISEVDQEINRRWQVQYRFRIVDGVSIDTFSDGVDDTVNVKAWGANPNGIFSSNTAGTGSVYTFQNMSTTMNDPGLYRAGDGSTTAQSILGTPDGFSYAIPIACVARRNSGVYDPNLNAFGCAATGPVGGLIASGVSGRPDGFFADQIDSSDILNLRHRVVFEDGFSFDTMLTASFDRLLRGNMISYFGRGDGAGAPNGLRSTFPLYAQEISTIGALDAGFKGFAENNFQRRIFSDAATIQQTQFTYTGAAAPDNALPTVLSAPAQPTGSTSTASGTLPAGTYGVKITYTNAFGESLPSIESAGLTIASNGNITINSPVSSGNASGWNVYVTSTVGSNWKKQNTVPTAIGTNFNQSTTLNGAGVVPPVANTTSSTLVVAASSNGLVNGTANVTCVDGSSTPGAGSLVGNVNILVYNASTNVAIAGSWSGLGTATATFTPTAPWGTGGTGESVVGVVAVLGLSYPAGNGMTFRAENVVAQTLVQGGTTTQMAKIGVTGVTAADNTHLNTPSAVFVDASGNVFVADTLNHRVVKYNSSLVYQSQFGVTGAAGADNTHLSSPYDVIVDGSGNIYVSDTGNHRIVKLNSTLNYSAQFGVTAVSANDTTHLNNPSQIGLDNGGTNIYIADTSNNRVVRITTAMAFGATVTTGLANTPIGLAVDFDGTFNQIFITQAHSVARWKTADGSTYTLDRTYGTAGSPGNTKYTFNTPKRLFTTLSRLNTGIGLLANSHNVLVSDTANHRVVEINPGFIYTAQFGVSSKTGTDFARLNFPLGIGKDTTGILYLADSANHRILKFHAEMGCCDFPQRQFEILFAGINTDRLKIWYNYRPYMGVIANQGSTTMNYTLRAVTEMKALVTTSGTAGRNASIEDNLSGSIVRLPLPFGSFGTSPSNNQTEWSWGGSSIVPSGFDSSSMFSPGSVSWGGAMATFGPSDPAGNQGGFNLAGSLIKIQQAANAAGFPFRGVNTISRFVDNLPQNGGFDFLGLSFGQTQAIDHLTAGYFLAVASGGNATLPVIAGEIVLVVVTFRTTGASAAIYGQTNVATAVDIFRVPDRMTVRF